MPATTPSQGQPRNLFDVACCAFNAHHGRGSHGQAQTCPNYGRHQAVDVLMMGTQDKPRVAVELAEMVRRPYRDQVDVEGQGAGSNPARWQVGDQPGVLWKFDCRAPLCTRHHPLIVPFFKRRCGLSKFKFFLLHALLLLHCLESL